VLRDGGVKGLTPAALDKKIDGLGLTLTSSIDRETGSVNLKSLSKVFPEAFKLFAAVLFQPSFADERLQISKAKLLEEIRRIENKPSSVASYKFSQMLYGEKSPWARRPSAQSVSKITRSDLQGFHQRYFVPSNMMIAISGDFNSQQVLALLKEYTKDYKLQTIIFPPLDPVKFTLLPQIKHIKKDTNQSFIRVGHFGIKRDNPDRFAIAVMNMILGGNNFTSRLMHEIRVEKGLSYGVSSSFHGATDYGLFEVATATKLSSTEEVLDIIKENVASLTLDAKIIQEELDFAKRSTLNRLVFQFDQPAKVLAQRLFYRFYDRPDDYWKVYKHEIERVSLQDVQRVAKTYLHPENLSILVVGPQAYK
jgi:predicted Zn-dependent peptidase